MSRNNRIALKFFTVALTVSFLYPFCSISLNAEETATVAIAEAASEPEQAEEEESVSEPEQEEQETSAEAEEESVPETERGSASEPEQEEQETSAEAEEESVPGTEQEEAPEPEQAEEEGVSETEQETESGDMADSGEEQDQLEAAQELQAVMTGSVMALNAFSAGDISEDDPEIGQSTTFGYTGAQVQWTVPVSGCYDIYCYGAMGGNGSASIYNKYSSQNYYWADTGSPGAMRASRVSLQQGTVLTIHVGGVGGKGKEGSYVGDHEAGIGGYNDGGRGSGKSTICSNTKMHNGSCASGGGGGSSYILYEGIKVISAAGGKGGDAAYKCDDGEANCRGGAGGGSNALCSADGLEWQTDELDVENYNENSGNGYILMTLTKIMPYVKLESSSTEWTCDGIELTATVKATGSGLEDNYISWENAEDGSDIWTDALTYTVGKNGTYTCKIRDVDGNTGTAEIGVDNIDKLKPSAEITSSQEWTTEPVVLTVSAEDSAATNEYGCSGLAEEAYLWGKNGDRQQEGIWGSDTTYTVSMSGSYFCKVRDRAGNVRKVDYYIGCIDVTAPSASLTADQTKPTWKDVTLTVTATDTGIGLAELPYCWEQDENGDDIWTAENTLVTDQNGLYCCKVRDALGNTTEVTYLVNNIDKSLKVKNDGGGGKHSGSDLDGNELQNSEQDQMVPDEILTEELVLPELQEGQDSDGDNGHRGIRTSGINRDRDILDKLQELLGMTDGEPEIMEEELFTPIRPALSFEPSDEDAQHGTVQKEKGGKHFFDAPDIKTVILYSAWMVVVLCGLAWLLFSLLFEHVTVYRADRKGRFRKAGRLVIVRKKDYRQVNLTPLQEKNEDRKYKLRFSFGFAYLNKKEKILIRTYHGVELRNIGREILL